MRILDRYVIRSFALNYVISLMVLISLYIVLDLYFNFDEFIQVQEVELTDLLLAIGRYYGAHLFLYFSQISGVITLFAMAFTLGRFQRNNEFVAIVSSGVSLHRIALTVIIVGAVLNGLWLLNQELALPRLAPQLAKTHVESVANEPYGVWFLKDSRGGLLSAYRFKPETEQLERVLYWKNQVAGNPLLVRADRARWVPGSGDIAGHWLLDRGEQLVTALDPDGAKRLDRIPIHRLDSDVGPDDIATRQSANWVEFLSRRELIQVKNTGVMPANQIAKTIHNRFATPIVNMLVLIIGIPFFLDREPSSIVQSGSRCFLVCGAAMLFAFICQSAISTDHPALTAWIPLIVLTPVMVISLDRLRT